MTGTMDTYREGLVIGDIIGAGSPPGVVAARGMDSRCFGSGPEKHAICRVACG